MNYVGQIFEFIQKLVIWWVTIMPWEEAVHVRLGKKIRILKAGLHLRIPFIDRVYVQTTRTRVVQMPPQTVTTLDGKTITVVLNMGFKIDDIYKLYSTLFHVEQTLCNILMGVMADEICRRSLEDCGPSDLEKELEGKVDGSKFGLSFEYIKVVGFAVVRTYRIIDGGHWLPSGLETDKTKA